MKFSTSTRLFIAAIALAVLAPFQYALACGYAYVTTCGTELTIAKDNIPTTFATSNCTWLGQLSGHNFGTVNTLTFQLGKTITWESCDNNIMNSVLHYRIYPVNQTPGAFTDKILTGFTQTNNGPYRTKTRTENFNLNVAAGLPTGTYKLELYYTSDVDFDLNNTVDFTLRSDNNGLNYISTFTINNGSTGNLSISPSSQTPPSCVGSTNGSIAVTVANGTPPYTYAWSNGSTTATATNLAAGTYQVTVMDAAAGMGVNSFSLPAPTAISIVMDVTPETSAPANNGIITAIPSGGSSPYTFLWSNNATTGTISNVNVGTFTVTVTDNKGCTKTQTATMTTAPPTPPGSYCNAMSNFPWYEWISNVQLGTINNTSIKTPYTFFNTQSTTLTGGLSYPLSLTSGFSWETFSEHWMVWIDYNRNGIFEEPSEIAFSQLVAAPPGGTTSKTTTGTILVPSNVTPGGTRMRVSMNRGTAAMPCGNLANGEVEDYIIELAEGGPPVCSITAAATNIACNNAGTTASGTDDTFTFSLLVTGVNAGTGWTTTINGTVVTGTYGTPKNLGPYLITGGNLAFTVRDSGDPTCLKAVTIMAPAPCSTPAPCSLTAAASSIVCNNNGTPSLSTDDTYTFSLLVNGSNAGTTWTTTVSGQNVMGTIGTSVTMGPFPIAQGGITLNIAATSGSTCSTVVAVTAPNTCSTPTPTCSISAVANNFVCNNNGTLNNPFDDYFTCKLTVTGTNAGTSWTSTINNQTYTGTYGTAVTIGPFFIAEGNRNIIVAAANTATCTFPYTVIAPPYCSTPNPSTTYCNFTSAFPWHDWIAGVKLNTIDAMSGKSVYSDFTNMSTSLTIGQSNSITLTSGFSWITENEYWQVWIDLNHDLDFNDAGEKVLNVLVPAPPGGTLSFPSTHTFTLPASTLPGQTRMRVVMSKDTITNPCGTLATGEIEDYSIVVNTPGVQPVSGTYDRLMVATDSQVDGIDVMLLMPDIQTETTWMMHTMNENGQWDSFTEETIATPLYSGARRIFDTHPKEGVNIYRIQWFEGTDFKYEIYATGHHESLSDYTLSPNPANDFIRVTLPEQVQAGALLQVYSSNGILLYHQVIPQDSSLSQWEIPTQSWKEGLYHLYLDVKGRKPIGKSFMVAH